MHEHWLLLTNYSAKYGISLSTLRRRIKAGELRCRFENGKYLLPDHPLSEVVVEVARNRNEPADDIFSSGEVKLQSLEKSEEPIMASATKVLSEIKRAYAQALQEKEEQIVFLKEEIADLKTLISVLESENDRLRPKRIRQNLEL